MSCVISCNCVVRTLVGDVAGQGQQLIERPRIRGGTVGIHLNWACAVLERTGEEPSSGR